MCLLIRSVSFGRDTSFYRRYALFSLLFQFTQKSLPYPEYAPIFKDFNLHTEHDLEFIYPPVQMAMVFSDGQSLCLYSDLEKSCQSISKFSKKDAETYREFYQFTEKAMDLFLAPATYVNPLPSIEQVAKLESNPITKRVD